MSLFLVRHGRTAWNLEGRTQGHTDEPLDAFGRQQAARLGEALRGAGVKRVVASDLSRAVETAASLGLPVETDARLRERSFGEWEGRPYPEIGVLFREAEATGTLYEEIRAPGGESFRDVWARLVPFAASITREDTLVVAHGGTLSCLMPMLLGGDLAIRHAFSFANCGINELRPLEDGRLRLARYGDVAHLADVV